MPPLVEGICKLADKLPFCVQQSDRVGIAGKLTRGFRQLIAVVVARQHSFFPCCTQVIQTSLAEIRLASFFGHGRYAVEE